MSDESTDPTTGTAANDDAADHPEAGETAVAGDPSDAAEAGATESENDESPEFKTMYVELPGGGHRITTRRTTHRRVVNEDVEETIEEIRPIAYQGPTPGSDQPVPVG